MSSLNRLRSIFGLLTNERLVYPCRFDMVAGRLSRAAKHCAQQTKVSISHHVDGIAHHSQKLDARFSGFSGRERVRIAFMGNHCLISLHL